MRADGILPALALPAAAVKNQAIDKLRLIARSLRSNASRIADAILDFRWLAAIDTPSTGVPSYVYHTRVYRTIGVFSVAVRPGIDANLVGDLIHDVVRSPAVIFVVYDRKVAQVSVAHKFVVNDIQDDRHAVVVDGANCCRIGETLADANFFDSLHWDEMPKRNLFEICQGWFDRIDALKTARLVGNFVLCSTNAEQLHRERTLKRIVRLSSHRRSLKQQLIDEFYPHSRAVIAEQIEHMTEALATLKVSLRTMRYELLNEGATGVLRAAGLVENT